MVKNELTLTGDELESTVSAMFKKNYLSGKDFYVQIDKRFVSYKDELQSIDDDQKGVNIGILNYNLGIYQEKTLSLLRQGYSVKILDLLIISPVVRGSVKSLSEAKSQREFTVKITPLPLLLDSVKNLSISDVKVAETKILISQVRGLEDLEGALIAGQVASVRGNNLKLGEEGSGLYFAPVGEDGKESEDRSQWTKVEKVLRNVNTELLVILPKTLSAGKYVIVAESLYSSKGVRKTPIIGKSEIVEVKGE